MTPNLRCYSEPVAIRHSPGAQHLIIPIPNSPLLLLTLGEKRHATVTLADRLIVTDIDVILSGTWLAVPKYSGTKASQMTHVVYMVNPATERDYTER